MTAGAPSSIDAALAADGVDDVLDKMYGGLPSWGSFDPLPHFIEFRLTDTGTSVWSQLGIFSGTSPEGDRISGEKDLHVVPDPGVRADVVVTGDASNVDAWLWRRRDDDGITVAGDPEIYAHARMVLDQPL